MPAYHLDQYRLMSSDELDAALFGLAVECPLGDCERRCPLDPLRDKPLRERFIQITALSHAGKLRLMREMVGCFNGLHDQEAATQNT